MNQQFSFVAPLVFMCLLVSCALATAEPSFSLNTLAGEYYQGDGLGVNCTLKLRKVGTFTFAWQGCLGIYDQNEGKAFVRDGALRLIPVKPNVRDGFRGMATTLVPVRWGRRTYLIEPVEMVDFCSEINGGIEPRKEARGRYYLRQDQWQKAVKGKPAVPAAYRQFLLAKPVEGKIIRLVGRRAAWVNLGTKDGVRPGMTLTAQGQDKILFASIKVEAAELDRSRIRCEWKDSQLIPGQRVTSRFFDRSQGR